MNDLMLYIMVAAMVGMFGWAGFEYVKAGYEFWKEQRRADDIPRPEREAAGLPSAIEERAAGQQAGSTAQDAAGAPADGAPTLPASEQESKPAASV